MSNTYDESSTPTIIELELKLFNLLETGFFTIQSYLIWIYVKVYQFLKINYFLNLVHIFICNVKARLNNNNTQRKNLLEWIQTKVREPHTPHNFTDGWKNGIALCALIEGVVPGSCPRFDLLNPEQSVNNIKLGLTLIKKNLEIDSPIESHEIHDCTEEAKLVYFLSRVKFESMKKLMKTTLTRSIIQVKDSSGNSHKVFESLFGDQKACFAKGMGLILGVRTRRARFNIFCKPTSKLNLMIEISGPNNSICSEKITIHNPKKRISADIVTTSLIADLLNRKKTNNENLKIPFFYEVFPNKIVVTYIPLMIGKHKLSIIWQGQHIMHSPYTVNVEDSGADSGRTFETHLNPTSPTKFLPGLQYPVSALFRRNSLCFDETATVVGRKVLRQVVMVNGKEKVINYLNSQMDDTLNQFNDTFDYDLTQFDTKSNYYEIKQKPEDCDYETQLCPSNSAKSYDFNQTTDLFDIIETDSIQSELSTASKALNDDQNNQSISYIDNNEPDSVITETERKESIDDINDFEELSFYLQKNDFSENINSFDRYINISNNDLGKDDILLSKQQIVTNPSTYLSQKSINNYINRSFLPVKNMIESWETKLSDIVSNDDNKQNNERNKIESLIRYTPVKNRCQVFEELKDSKTSKEENGYSLKGKEFDQNFSVNDKKQFWEDLTTKKTANEQKENSNVSDDNQKVDELNHNKYDKTSVNQYLTEQSIIENSNKSSLEKLSLETVMNTPESQPDSGISTNIFCNLNKRAFHQNLLRQKSYSYPDLNRLSNFFVRELDLFKDNINEDQNNNTRTSSLIGQFIDDEIPDYSSLFMGEYVSYTGLLNTDRPMTFDDIKFNDLTDEENDLNSNKVNLHNSTADFGIYPEKCQVFGAGVYYGQVGIKNHFVVSTKEGGKSFLAVGIQSAEQDDIIEVTVTSIGDKNYEVLYEVSRPGYYIIFVKWGDYNVPDSPFICKVTL